METTIKLKDLTIASIIIFIMSVVFDLTLTFLYFLKRPYIFFQYEENRELANFLMYHKFPFWTVVSRIFFICIAVLFLYLAEKKKSKKYIFLSLTSDVLLFLLSGYYIYCGTTWWF